jgi:lipopolysaccharide transport system permease protein
MIRAGTSADVIDAATHSRAGSPAEAAGARHGRAGRVRDSLLALTESDLRARYGRGSWRLVKWFLDPFAALGIYLVLVSLVLDRGGADPGVSIACAVVPFQLVMMSVVGGMGSISLRRSIVLNMSFDRSLIPISSVLTETVAFGASLGLLALMMGIYGVVPTVAALWLPACVVVTVVLSISLAYPAALVGLWFPDIRVFAVSIMRTLFFVAPSLVPLSEVPGRAADLLKINPLSGIFEAFRAVLLYGETPAAWQLGIPLGFSAVLLAVFVPLYRREQSQFAKVVE